MNSGDKRHKYMPYGVSVIEHVYEYREPTIGTPRAYDMFGIVLNVGDRVVYINDHVSLEVGNILSIVAHQRVLVRSCISNAELEVDASNTVLRVR